MSPRTPITSKGPATRAGGRYTQFAKDVIDAQGEWVEIDLGRDGASNAYRDTLMRVGQKFAEVTQRKGILYGRMKESK